ncbi:MAG: hypothetical protein NUV84_00830 [Candidatus Uhrbacteria bacterium]|nr:hypothetical protein [Candidatus Uhrbacteria bacterium]
MEYEHTNAPPMSGEEIAAMFGETEVLKMEQQFKAISEEIDSLGIQIKDEQDQEELERLHAQLSELREQMRVLHREIRVQQRRFGDLRGPRKL